MNRLEALREKFPNLFAKLNYLGTEAGWDGILMQLGETLEPMCEANDEGYDDVYVVQAKEKFGELRFYMSAYPENAYQLIEEAEKISRTTCETCGAPGELRKGGWLKTRCDSCQAKHVEQRHALLR